MKRWFCLFLAFVFLASFSVAQVQEGEKKEKEKQKEEKLPVVTESITVEAKIPRDLPYATTSSVKTEQLELLKPKDLTDVLSYTSGTYISVGSKNEWTVKIRGLANSRITLLYDGVPVYEPYYNSFDLKTLASDQVDSVKVVKGASSVLYGPNALGGIVDILTRRPTSDQLTLRLDYGTRDTYGIYGSGGLRGKNWLFSGAAFREGSDGFNWKSGGKTELRQNSDYVRNSLGGKLFFYPAGGSELLAEVNYYQTEYGIPTAISFAKKNYWRFKDWQRLLTNLGGSFPIWNNGYVKARLYYVKHYNVLDAYKTSDFDTLANNRQWESTYNNYALGAFVLGMLPVSDRNDLSASFTYRDDRVKTQSDLNKPWEKYNHRTASLGLEDHFRFVDKVEVMAGASVDHLSKQTGENKTTVNPILGVKFNPRDWVDFHLTLSQKSRFPSMKNLYSIQMGGGNPDLRDEKGTNVEFGFTYDREAFFSGAVFYNRIHDLIDGRINSEGFFQYINVARARLAGLELEARKTLGPVSLSANYTWLDAKNLDTGSRLDLIPSSQFNAIVRFSKPRLFSLTLWGLYASNSIAHDSKGAVVFVAPYTVIHLAIEREIGDFSVYLKFENLLNEDYVTDPGFPMKARTISAGIRFLLQKKQ